MSEIKKKVVKIKSAFSDERGEIKDIIVGNFNSANEILGAMFIFTVLAFTYNLLTTLKVLESFDGNDWPIKHAIRPLIPMIVILIRFFTL